MIVRGRELTPSAPWFPATTQFRRVVSRPRIAPGEEERDYLARMLYSMYLGDFVSVYIAILKGHDPTPVSAIESFKRDLAGI